jgi:RNA polymerase sigma-B factor
VGELTVTATRAPDSPAQAQVARSEEQALFRRLRRDGDPAARDALLRRFMPLAQALAQRYRGAEDIEDLEQVAAIGLVKAIDRFDPERGVAFSSFAFPTIRGELMRHLRDRGWALRVPRDVQERAVRVDRVSTDLVSELGRSPTAAELADRVGTTVELVLEALQAATARRALSLDEPQRDDENERAFDVAVIETGFARAEDADELERLAAILSERERVILGLRFHEELTQSQIGELVGVSQMQVSRILHRAIARLQAVAPAARV